MQVRDIHCPDCGRADPVRKEGIGHYVCGACGREFDHEDVQ